MISLQNKTSTAEIETSVEKLPELKAVTSLRVLACMAIVLMHAQTAMLIKILPDGKAVSSLAQGVTFFFCLSGFVLAYNYQELRNWTDRRIYLINRAARILPLYLVSGLACLAVPGLIYLGPFPIYPLLSYYLLLQDWFKPVSLQLPLNAAGHSLSSETFFYLIFLLLASFGRRFIVPAIIGLLASTILVYLFPLKSNLFTTLPISFSIYFLVGMLAAKIFAKVRPAAAKWNNLFLFTGIEICCILSSVLLSIFITSPTPEGLYSLLTSRSILMVPLILFFSRSCFRCYDFCLCPGEGRVSFEYAQSSFGWLGTCHLCAFLDTLPDPSTIGFFTAV